MTIFKILSEQGKCFLSTDIIIWDSLLEAIFYLEPF